MPGRFPIIYVRGFAGRARGINKAADDPFYGFSTGSTHVRVGCSGDPIFYQFESPLIRLVTEMGYNLFVAGGQDSYLDSQPNGAVPPNSIWIHRFYDKSATTWERRKADRGIVDEEYEEASRGRPDLTKPEAYQLERAAEDLLRLVEKVLEKTHFEPGAHTVHLVAHSMGGLICRSMIQRVIPDSRRRAADFVDRLFTYGTPHGGIEFEFGFGLLEELRDEFGIVGSDIFGPKRMYEYLTPSAKRRDRVPPRNWDPRDNPDPQNFPTERIFCLAGTNPEDYAAAFGLSARTVGVKSDGLVQIENALVTDADHAYVHRSHSGRYGMVNSEEGYQNLIRFLFGDVKVAAELIGLSMSETARKLTWQAEVRVAVRGLPVLLHEQTAAHHCPIPIETGGAGSSTVSVPLVTSYLWTERARPSMPMRYTLHLRLLSLVERDRIFFWEDHVEQSTDFDDVLVVDVKQGAEGMVGWAEWKSKIEVPLRDYHPAGPTLGDLDPRQGLWRADVPFPASGRFVGPEAKVRLTAQPAL